MPVFRWLLVCALLQGCATVETRTAKLAEREGRVLDAAAVWLTALEADTEDPVSRKRLVAILPSAWDTQIDTARDFEASGQQEQAIEAYHKLLAFADRAVALDVEVPSTAEIRTEVAATEEALAERHYQSGQTAAGERRFPDAVTEYTAAQAVRPGYRDTNARLAQVWHDYATADLEAKRYRDALTHFEAASGLGDEEATSWAAAVHLAWGRLDLKEGRCRAAYEHLRVALGHTLDTALPGDVEHARTCARLEFAVSPFEDLTAQVIQGTSAPGIVLSDRLEVALRAGGSEHLRLVDPTSPAPKSTADGRRYVVRGRITALRLDRPQPTVVPQTLAAHTLISCGADQANTFSETDGFLCESEVELKYTEHVRRVVVTVGGSVRVLDEHGEQIAALPLDHEQVAEVRWADNYTVGGVPAVLGTEPGLGVVGVSTPLLPTTEATGVIGSDAALMLNGLEVVAGNAAKVLLEQLDRPTVPVDPIWLDVRAPKVDAEDLQFKPVDGTQSPI